MFAINVFQPFEMLGCCRGDNICDLILFESVVENTNGIALNMWPERD
jgi:hypothetical protein